LTVIGGIAYGMIASGLHTGFDQPFAFDIAAQTFQTMTGITGSNVQHRWMDTGRGEADSHPSRFCGHPSRQSGEFPINGMHWNRLCGARTKSGHPCYRWAVPGKLRCKLHGGASTGPKFWDGSRNPSMRGLKAASAGSGGCARKVSSFHAIRACGGA
jgi:hypothetical protein